MSEVAPINSHAAAEAHKALMSELFLICQPKFGEVFGFMDDHPEVIHTIVRAYLAATPTEWQDIESAPTLDRVFVAGWQPRHGNTEGYWWLYEDMTDENGKPIDHPNATMWRKLPAPPASRNGEGRT